MSSTDGAAHPFLYKGEYIFPALADDGTWLAVLNGSRWSVIQLPSGAELEAPPGTLFEVSRYRILYRATPTWMGRVKAVPRP